MSAHPQRTLANGLAVSGGHSSELNERGATSRAHQFVFSKLNGFCHTIFTSGTGTIHLPPYFLNTFSLSKISFWKFHAKLMA